jgi:hypothetical protein
MAVRRRHGLVVGGQRVVSEIDELDLEIAALLQSVHQPCADALAEAAIAVGAEDDL